MTAFFWLCTISSLATLYEMLYFLISSLGVRQSFCKTSQAHLFCFLYLWSPGPSFSGPATEEWPAGQGHHRETPSFQRNEKKNGQEWDFLLCLLGDTWELFLSCRIWIAKRHVPSLEPTGNRVKQHIWDTVLGQTVQKKKEREREK